MIYLMCHWINQEMAKVNFGTQRATILSSFAGHDAHLNEDELFAKYGWKIWTQHPQLINVLTVARNFTLDLLLLKTCSLHLLFSIDCLKFDS